MTTEIDSQDRMDEIVSLKDQLKCARKRIAHLECVGNDNLGDWFELLDEDCQAQHCDKICEKRVD